MCLTFWNLYTLLSLHTLLAPLAAHRKVNFHVCNLCLHFHCHLSTTFVITTKSGGNEFVIHVNADKERKKKTLIGIARFFFFSLFCGIQGSVDFPTPCHSCFTIHAVESVLRKKVGAYAYSNYWYPNKYVIP